MYVCVSPRGEVGRVVMKFGPHDQKSYLLESLVFFFFFFVLDFTLCIHNYRLLECILFFLFASPSFLYL